MAEKKNKKPSRLCAECGTNPKMKGKDICEACNEIHKNQRILPFGIICFVLCLAVSCAALGLFIFNAQTVKCTRQAQKATVQHRLSDAESIYNDCFQQIYDFNTLIRTDIPRVLSFFKFDEKEDIIIASAKMRQKYLDSLSAVEGPAMAGNTSGNFATEEMYKKYPGIKAYADEWSIYYNTSNVVYDYAAKLYNGAVEGEEAYKETKSVIKSLDAYRERHPETDFWLQVFEYEVVAQFSDDTTEERVKRLDKICADYPDRAFLIYDYYISIYDSLKDREKTEYWCNKAIEYNRNDVGPYITLIRSALTDGKGEEAKKLYNDFASYNGESSDTAALMATILRVSEGVEASKSYCDKHPDYTSEEFERQKALNSLCTGDYKEAFLNVFNLYVLNTAFGSPVSNELAQTTYMAAILCKTNNISVEYLDEFLGEDYKEFIPQLSGDIRDIINGKKTCKDVLTTGCGDFVFDTEAVLPEYVPEEQQGNEVEEYPWQ